MRSLWTLLLMPALGLATWGVTPLCWSADKANDKSAEDKAEDVFYANRMIVSALEAEARGDFAARERLLKDAAQLDAAPIAQAHLGLINVGAKKADWKTIDDSMLAATKEEKLLQYEKTREKSPDTAAGHLEMAKWCLRQKLEDQARAHLTRLLDFLPDHAAAREALGFVRVGDKWLSPAEIQQLQLNAALKTKSIEKHGHTIATLIARMKSSKAKDRDAALAEFLAIRDVSAVGAVETALNTPDESTTELLIKWMGQVDCPESSLVLARYSLLHPNVLLRDQATAQLVKRPLHDFVPELLKLLSSPITMLVQPSYDWQGKFLGYRQAFGREGMDEKDIKIFGDQIQWRTVNTPSLLRPTADNPRPNNRAANILTAQIDESARQKAQEDILLRKLEMDRQNAFIAEVNERIALVIAKVSGKPLTQKPEEMWTWWDQYNETEYNKYKPERYRTTYTTCYLPHYFNPSCFAAGTSVLTQTGPMAIEKIQTGDLVLNKDMQTGELQWRPVLKPTVRPPSPMTALTFEGETIRCTNSHLFWVSGAGWKKASELKAGDILHGAKTPARILAVEAQPKAETYNLVVADSPNYFVGQNMLLTHDVTPRESNHQTFPGQDQVRQLSEQRPVRKTASR